jgi:hypothetical protein
LKKPSFVTFSIMVRRASRRPKLLFRAVFLAAALPAFALDFGLVTGQSAEYTNAGDFGGAARSPAPAAGFGSLNYTGSYGPWLSAELGGTARLYLSMRIRTVYEYGEWKPANPPLLPELGRFEFSWRPLSGLYLEAGRLRFEDPAGMIASGLFDGLSGSLGLGAALLGVRVFYTGFLYKESARITMTPGDSEWYALPAAFDNSGGYFASRRALVSTEAEFGDLTPRSSLVLNALAQFDVNGKPGRGSGDFILHTQYLSAKYTVLPVESLTVTETAAAGLAESRGEAAAFYQTRFHYAAAASLEWETPGALRDMFRGEARWAGGAAGGGIAAFTPLNQASPGRVFTPDFSGLVTVKGNYTARFHHTFSASLEGTYFIRTDEETLKGAEYPASAARFLGGELYGNLVWAPVSDFTATLGGGAFFPGWGNAFVPGAPVRWKVTAGIILSL